MSVQQGMDTARIREIADQLRAQRTRIDDVQQRGTTSMNVLHEAWKGPDLDDFSHRWDGDAVKRLMTASTQIGAAADLMVRQAEQQDETSGEGGGGTGGPGGPGGGPGGPGGTGGTGGQTGGDDAKPGDATYSYDVTGRDKDSMGVRTNKDEEGNLHHYDPLTGKRWVEDKDGKWVNESDPTGHSSLTKTETTAGKDGWETERESTRGEGGGRKEYGESWSKEKDFDENIGSRAKDVLDNVQSEPIVEKKVEAEASAAVAQGEVGDEKLGASGEVLSAEANADAAAGIDATRGAYAEANAHAGAYLGKGEAHWANDSGTSAEVEASVGAEANANAEASIGPGGAKVEAGLDAFAGGKAGIEGSQEFGDVGSVTAGAEVSYGIGAEANVDAEFSWDKISIGGEANLTLGIGGGINFDVSISPKGIVDWLNPFD